MVLKNLVALQPDFFIIAFVGGMNWHVFSCFNTTNAISQESSKKIT